MKKIAITLLFVVVGSVSVFGQAHPRNHRVGVPGPVYKDSINWSDSSYSHWYDVLNGVATGAKKVVRITLITTALDTLQLKSRYYWGKRNSAGAQPRDSSFIPTPVLQPEYTSSEDTLGLIRFKYVPGDDVWRAVFTIYDPLVYKDFAIFRLSPIAYKPSRPLHIEIYTY